MLDLGLFARTNAERAKLWHPNFPHSDWTLADWSNAMCGEAGEAANVVKKLRRLQTVGAGRSDQPLDELLDSLGEELADTITYALLLASVAGIDIEHALVSKFNFVSEREGLPIRSGWTGLSLAADLRSPYQVGDA